MLRVLAGIHAHAGDSRHGTDGIEARLRQRAAQSLPMQILRHHAPAQAGDDAAVAFDDQIRLL